MVTVKARVLPAPILQYHKISEEPEILPKDGMWNLKDKKLVEGIKLRSWAVIVFGHEDKYSVSVIQNFITALCSTFSNCGLSVENPTPPISYANVRGNIQRILNDACIIAESSYSCKAQLIFCILPNIGVPLYAEIKRVSDTVLGIVTQCLQGKHILKPKLQLCANIALKINAKLGGQNSKLSSVFLPVITETPTIIFGADISV